MSTGDIVAASVPIHETDSAIGRFEQKLERWGERLNPILVKEARQALKSRQFIFTFSLLLIAAWVWSVLGILMRMPDIYFAPAGMSMLLGYYFILGVPMLLIVPFTAFRSLASEREDQTYELLSISTLSSRQIITGKLGSAILQMIVYYSALAPCIAFTYLLRGVDIVSVLLLLAYTFLLSVLLCCLGLVLAGVSRSRQWQSLVSVLLLLMLIVFAFFWASMIGGIVFSGVGVIALDSSDFWLSQAAVLMAILSYAAILILVASAQNSFASDNRSTRIRIALFVQTVLFIGWIAFGWSRVADGGFLFLGASWVMIHWYVYGVLMSGESGKLSPRVRRQLPKSFFGRVFLTWFNPGSGSGYVFAVSHVLLLMGLAAAAVTIQSDFGVPAGVSRQTVGAVTFFFLLAAYYVIYVGVSRIIVRMIPNRERYGLPLPTLINLVLLLVGCAVPYFFDLWRHDYVRLSYSWIQAPNWMWTLREVTRSFGAGYPIVAPMVFVTAVVVLVINLRMIRSEIESVRVEAPQRVKTDEAAGNQP